MTKYYDMSKIDKDAKIHFIIGSRKQKLEQRNIELQQRLFNIQWNIDTVIKLIEAGNTDKALKLLKKVRYNG